MTERTILDLALDALRKQSVALKVVRFQWASHAQQCNFVLGEGTGKCNCDWPEIATQCDDALRRAAAAVEAIEKMKGDADG